MNAPRGRCLCSSSWSGEAGERDPSWPGPRSPGCAPIRTRRPRRRPRACPVVAEAARRAAARPWRRRPAGRPHPLADQPAADPRPRPRDVARRRDRGNGPPRLAARLGSGLGAAATSIVAGHVERAACCRCSIARRAAGADRLLPWRDDGDRRGQPASRSPGLVTLAAPWDFSAYPDEARAALEDMWTRRGAVARSRSACFRWRCCRRPSGRSTPSGRCASSRISARSIPTSAEARRFVALEEWANEGEPLPYPAARELIESLFRANASGQGRWLVGGQAARVPERHPDAPPDRAATTASRRPRPRRRAQRGRSTSGHVGMIVGSARAAASRPDRRLPRT